MSHSSTSSSSRRTYNALSAAFFCAVAFLCCSSVLATSPCSNAQTPAPSGGWPTPFNTQRCSVTLDLTLVLDYSISIWTRQPQDWQTMLRFAQRFVRMFTSAETRFSIITFNGEAQLEVDNHFVSSTQALSTLQCMMAYNKPTTTGTNIGKALKIANDQNTDQSRVKVYLVITDGKEEAFDWNGRAIPMNSIMQQQRDIAFGRGVHIATVQVGTDQAAKAELKALASSPEFFTSLTDFNTFEDPNSEFQKKVLFGSVCLSVSGVLPTVISLPQSQHPDMLVDVSGTALTAARTISFNAAYVSLNTERTPDGQPYIPVLFSKKACVFDPNAYRLHCSMPQAGLQEGGRYAVELQNEKSGERTTDSQAVLAVKSDTASTATGSDGPICWDCKPNTTEVLILGMTVLNFTVLMVILGVLMLFMTFFVWFLRRPVNGHPRWHSYRDSCRNFFHNKHDSWRTSWQSWHSSWRKPAANNNNTAGYPQLPRHTKAAASQDLEMGRKSLPTTPPPAFSDSIMGLPPRSSAIPRPSAMQPSTIASPPKKMSVYTPPPPATVIETEMMPPSSRSPSNQPAHHSRSPSSTYHTASTSHHHHSHQRSHDCRPLPADSRHHHHGHHNSCMTQADASGYVRDNSQWS